MEILKILDNLSKIYCLKSNKAKCKCKIAEIGALKGLRVALCGIQCINLNKETVKILRIHFSKKKLGEEKFFNIHIAKTENALRV